MFRTILMAWLFLTAIAHASVTAAWKVPVDIFAPGYRQEEELPGDSPAAEAKMSKPPGESAFFEPGDELWDISVAVIDHARTRRGAVSEEGIKWSGEWMVWNARSQMIIARGSEADIMMADAALDLSVLPVLARTKLELVRGEDPKIHQLSVLSASGETASVKVDGIEAKVRAVDPGLINGRTEHDILVSWQSAEEKAEVSVHIDLYDLRSRIARFGTGKDQWELFASGGLSYSHGVPVSEVRWKEDGGKVVVWPVGPSETAVAGLDEELKIAIFKVRPDLPSRLGGGEDGAEDPFGEKGGPPALVKIPVSEELGRWMGGELLDLKPLLRQNGMRFDHAKAYAGYDEISHRLFMIASPIDIDLCEQIITGIGCVISRGAWTETDAATGNWGIACRSREESWIKLSTGDRTAGFKIRPDFADGWPKIDTIYQMDLMTEGSVRGRLESRATLLDAVPSQIGSYQLPEGNEVKVTLTVDAGYP
jgi:hypothetical protein